MMDTHEQTLGRLSAELTERSRATAVYEALLGYYGASPESARLLAALRQRVDVGEYDAARYLVSVGRNRLEPGVAARYRSSHEAARRQLSADRDLLRQAEEELGLPHLNAALALERVREGALVESPTNEDSKTSPAEGGGVEADGSAADEGERSIL